MVFCIVAMAVFAVMGLFSAKYRHWAGEAWKCAFKKITFRPCDADFDQRWRGKIVSTIGSQSPAAGKFVFKHFQALSMLFLILMIASFAYAALGLYNLAVYNNCNGPNSSEFCPISGTGGTTNPPLDSNDCDLNQTPVPGKNWEWLVNN